MKFKQEVDRATRRAEQRQALEPRAIAARYDKMRRRIVVELSTASEFAFPPQQAQGLEHARPADLRVIEISPSGYGLRFPKLDADLWLPALMENVFGSRAWIAARLGAQGGHARSSAKARAARANGKLGGRPRQAEGSRVVKRLAAAAAPSAPKPKPVLKRAAAAKRTKKGSTRAQERVESASRRRG